MIEVVRSDGLCRITLDRPEKANALTEAMLADLVGAVEAAREDRALILTGTGKVFSAGADIDAARAGLATSDLWERLSTAIAAHQGLTIAALNGSCAGGAMGMMLACDMRLCVPGARFFYPVMKLGFLPQPSDPGRLVRHVGESRAKMILMAGCKIDAQTALAWGLVDEIVTGELLAASEALTVDVRAAAPDHVAAIKAMTR